MSNTDSNTTNKRFLVPGLRPLSGKVRKYDIFAFDVETCDNNRTFVCCSVVGCNFVRFFTDKESFKEWLASDQRLRNAYLCATNLMFDFFAIFDRYEALEKFDIIDRSSSLVYAKCYASYRNDDTSLYSQKQASDDDIKDYYKITFIDSTNHLMKSVKDLGKIIKLPKLECPIVGQMPANNEEWRMLKEYNIRDSMITYQFMTWLQDEYNKLGCNMKITISGTSIDLFRRKYLPSFWRQEKRQNIIDSYQAYYGGRTEAFERGLFDTHNYGKIKVFDVNSLYPHCMRKFEFPFPSSTHEKKISTEDIENYQGFCKAELKAPDISIPFLPVRTDKLRFCTGKIKGIYDFASLKFALDLGYDITKLGEGYVYKRTFAPFRKYVDELYALRKEYKKNNDSSDLIPKILLNSFYGRWGYNFINKETLMLADNIFGNPKYKKCTIIPVGNDSPYFRVKNTSMSRIPSYCFPIISTYVTSYARQEMYRWYKRTGFDRVLYTDTDCIFTTRNMDTDDGLGSLKLEKIFEKVIIIKPKMYYGIDMDGKELLKIKGVNNMRCDFQDFQDKLKDGSIKIGQTRFTKLRGSMRGKTMINETYHMDKTIDLDDDKRLWDKEHFSIDIQKSRPIKLYKKFRPQRTKLLYRSSQKANFLYLNPQLQ